MLTQEFLFVTDMPYVCFGSLTKAEILGSYQPSSSQADSFRFSFLIPFLLISTIQLIST